MALNGSNVESKSYRDAKYSSGDSNKIKSKQYQEENNNNIDELSKQLSEMGCIVDAVKRPPNICIETCVYEEPNDGDSHNDNNTCTRINEELNNDETNYSDEFDEESGSDNEEIKDINNTAPTENTSELKIDKTELKIVNSLSSTVSKPQSTRSSDFGSVSVTQSRRKNMSFSNTRLRDIERQNHILLTKILSARNNKRSSIPPREQPVWKPVPAAAVLRKNQQKRIDHDNMILLKKIQHAKSSACSIRR